MSSQPVWSQHEAAILFEGYLQVINGEETRTTIVERVSKNLRNMALNSGFMIDDVYRNTHGVSLQLSSIESAYLGYTKGIAATKLFIKTVELWKNHPDDFSILLAEAHTMVFSKITKNDVEESGVMLKSALPIKEAFFAFAIQKRSTYTQSRIEVLMKNASEFSRTQILGETDHKKLSDARRKIESGILLKMRYGTDAKAIRELVALYCTFLKGYNPEKEQLEEANSQLVSSSMLAENSETNEAESEIVKDVTVHQNSFLPEDASTMHVDFEHNQDLAYTQPYAYTYRGIQYKATSWGKMFLEICSLLLLDQRERFLQIMNGDVPGTATLTYADAMHKNDMRSPREFATGYYAETNISATGIVRRLRGLYHYFNLTGQLDITYYKKEEPGKGPITVPKEWIIDKLSELELTYEDKRDKNGCLWVLGGDELSPFVREAREHGYRFNKKQDYGNTFSNQTRWYTMDRPAEKAVLPKTSDISELLNRFEKWLLADRRYADRTAYSYRSAVKVSYDYIAENHLEIDLTAEPEKAARVLMAREDFAERNRQQNNRYSAALGQLELFLTNHSGDVIVVQETPPNADPDIERYHRLLADFFSDGIRLRANIPLRKLRRCWQETYQEELPAEEGTVWNAIESICIVNEGYGYLPETLVDDDCANRIRKYIEESFTSGQQLVYFNAAYRNLQTSLEGSRIYSEDTLRTYLRFLFPQYAFTNRYMAVNSRVMPKLDEEIEGIIRNHITPISVEDVYDALSYAPKKEIDAAWYKIPNLCRNAQSEYFHADAIDLTQEELQRIAELIQSGIEENGYVTASELYNTIHSAWPDMVERYSAFSYLGYREALKRKLGNQFDFNAEVISAIGRNMTIADVFTEYGRHHEHFTSADVAALCETLNGCFYLEALLTYSLRLSPDEYVSQKSVCFDVEKTDEALESCVKGEYLPFSEMYSYFMLPYFGYPWNEYVLEQYLDKYSKRFKLLHGGYNQTKVSAAIVRKDAPFETYFDLMADALALSGCALNEASALEWLLGKKYIARKRFSDIGKLLTQARLIRERKGV